MNKKGNNVTHRLLWAYPLLLVFLSLIILSLSFYFKNYLNEVLFNLFQVIGASFFSIAIVTILLEFKNWKDYFERILLNILKMESHLSTLDKERLSELLRSLLKAYFKNSCIDEKGTFFWHFKDNLVRYVSEPYRTNISASIQIEDVNDDENTLTINDVICYDLYKNGTPNFPIIKWIPDDGEFLKVDDLKIQIKDLNGILLKEYLPSEDKLDLNKKHEVSLAELKESIDSVSIRIESKYKIDIGNYQYWQMPYPTKNFIFSASFPENLSIRVKPMVIDSNSIEIISGKNSYLLKYNNWILPTAGVVWSFLKKKPFNR